MLVIEVQRTSRDRQDHFKVVGLKNLANTKKHLVQCFTIYLWALHLIILASKSGCNRSDMQTSHSSIGQSPIIPQEFFPCQLEP